MSWSGRAGTSPVWLWGPVVAYMAIIFALSSRHALPAPFELNDKVIHFVVYAGLAVVTLRATAAGRVGGIRVGTVATAWLIATVYGASDEFHQSFVPGRSADVWDLVADGAGALLAVLGLWAIGIIVRSPASLPREPGA